MKRPFDPQRAVTHRLRTTGIHESVYFLWQIYTEQKSMIAQTSLEFLSVRIFQVYFLLRFLGIRYDNFPMPDIAQRNTQDCPPHPEFTHQGIFYRNLYFHSSPIENEARAPETYSVQESQAKSSKWLG